MLKIAHNITAALSALPDTILARSGGVFYSGQPAFSGQRDFYILGLNPGGNPEVQAKDTVAKSVTAWSDRPAPYSSYVDEEWAGKAAGAHGLQPRLRHLADRLGIDLRMTPASNVVFVRTRNEKALRNEKHQLLSACWPVHAAVIEALSIKAVICLGGTAGLWTRKMLHAHAPAGEFREQNNRGWVSTAHLSPYNVAVLTLAHPSYADWRNPLADPSELVRSSLSRVADAGMN